MLSTGSMRALRIDTVRARLTFFYVSTLTIALVVVGGLIYVLLARALYSRIDQTLTAVVRIAATSLANDLAEGQDTQDAARSTAAELDAQDQMVAIFDGLGRLLAESGREDDLEFTLPPLDTVPADDVLLSTVFETDGDDRHRMAMRRVTVPPQQTGFVVVVAGSLETPDEELASLRDILAYVVPLALLLAGIGGWFLARQSLAPVAAMAERARRLGAVDLSGRLPVANPRDELGRLAATFNDLLGRLEVSLTQQRHFMADASHEMRTPVTTVRTAAHVALQQVTRPEEEYRSTLSLIEQQAVRLSRLVDDMFTLARADAGNYPVRRTPLYLDELLDDAVRASRVVAAGKNVRVELDAPGSAGFSGDEDLIRRLVTNLLDNAIRHTASGTTVKVTLTPTANGYAVAVRDEGAGIPASIQPRIFERFYRGDAGHQRSGTTADGAGLGLALVRWIARIHGGDVVLTESSGAGTTFTATLSDGSGREPPADTA
jgi:heavy metal sensor kinase